MNVKTLGTELQKIGVPQGAYQLSIGLPNEKFCIGQNGSKWETYYSERGNKSGLKEFTDEESACEYFYSWMKKTFKK